ncbi:hypothetical protein ACJJTC_016251 [Scirpophaga incertulas]
MRELRLAYQYLQKAMAMRYDTRYGLLLKNPADPIPAYDNWKETTTLEEVERLANDSHGLHMEGLTVRRALRPLPGAVAARAAAAPPQPGLNCQGLTQICTSFLANDSHWNRTAACAGVLYVRSVC